MMIMLLVDEGGILVVEVAAVVGGYGGVFLEVAVVYF